MKNGVIHDWDGMEELWRHGFHKLGVATEDQGWQVSAQFYKLGVATED